MTRKIEVDFNSRDDNGFVPALIRHPRTRLPIGSVVQAFDDEGYRCVAVVESLTDGLPTVSPLWQTFAAPGESLVTNASASPALLATWKNMMTLSISRVVSQIPVSGEVFAVPAGEAPVEA
jgi:hypothetical protein